MAVNSTISLQQLVDDTSTIPDLAPALAVGGYSNQPAISAANDTMTGMVLGGPIGQPFNWKWNRTDVSPFATISWQQDYFVPGVSDVSWIESAWVSNINSTSLPKEKKYLEVHRDLQVTYWQTGYPGKICWIPNKTAQTGTWGESPLGPTAANPSGETTSIGNNLGGLQNPGPDVVYTNPVGQPNQPINATTCITDPNGNLWTLTTFGTCGSSEPSWPSNPVYPTYRSPDTVATTVTDGTAIWTAIDPNGQAFRLNPIPPQTGIVWMVQVVAQARLKIFTSLSDTLDPVPDDFYSWFRQGFQAQCYRRSPDPKVRIKFQEEWALWLSALDKAVRSGQREMDDFGFYPGTSIMDSGQGVYVGPAYPWPNPWGS